MPPLPLMGTGVYTFPAAIPVGETSIEQGEIRQRELGVYPTGFALCKAIMLFWLKIKFCKG